jgi:hemerythrin-like domain-containing protein
MSVDGAIARSARAAALEQLRQEHRSLAKVINGLQTLTAEVGEETVAVDFPLLCSMLYYVDAVPERLHHPKEERHLFAALERRDPTSIPLLARLRLEHERSPAMIGALESTLVRWQGGAPDGYDRFAESLQAFCDFHWSHMRSEEEDVFPRAEQHLAGEDWVAMADAFGANEDPLFGAVRRHEFERLYQRIANLAPRKLRLSLKNAAGGPR